MKKEFILGLRDTNQWWTRSKRWVVGELGIANAKKFRTPEGAASFAAASGAASPLVVIRHSSREVVDSVYQAYCSEEVVFSATGWYCPKHGRVYP